MRSLMLSGLCLLAFLAPWSVAAGIMTNPTALPMLTLAEHSVCLHGVSSHRAANASHPIADDGVTHFFTGLQPVEVLPSSASFLPLAHYTSPGVAKDPLSLTQRRRE